MSQEAEEKEEAGWEDAGSAAASGQDTVGKTAGSPDGEGPGAGTQVPEGAGPDADAEASREGSDSPAAEGIQAQEQDIPDASEENTQDTADGTERQTGEGKEAAPETGEVKKSLFGKRKDKLSAKLEEKVAELEDARMRQLAEFENFRKRSEKEKNQMFEVGAKSVVEKILPVVDNFERGLAGVPEEEKGTPFVEGVEMVYKQMLTALEEIGVKPIEAVGQPFDPNFHNAVMTVEDEGLESGSVAEELQKGYLYRDSVVRHSMVKVVS